MKKSLILASLLATSEVALAQQRPDAGQQIQQIPLLPAVPRQAPDIAIGKAAAQAVRDAGGATSRSMPCGSPARRCFPNSS